MITKRLRRSDNDLYFICFNCKKNTYVKDVVPLLGNTDEIDKRKMLHKTSKSAPIGTPKTFFMSLGFSLITAFFVADLLDFPPILTILCFGFVFEFILNPIFLHFWGLHRTIWVHICENCNMKWSLVIQNERTVLLIFKFLF